MRNRVCIVNKWYTSSRMNDTNVQNGDNEKSYVETTRQVDRSALYSTNIQRESLQLYVEQ